MNADANPCIKKMVFDETIFFYAQACVMKFAASRHAARARAGKNYLPYSIAKKTRDEIRLRNNDAKKMQFMCKKDVLVRYGYIEEILQDKLPERGNQPKGAGFLPIGSRSDGETDAAKVVGTL